MKEKVQAQRDFFQTHQTLEIAYRLQTLKKIEQWIKHNEQLIVQALKEDLHKDQSESYMCEIGLVLSDIHYQIKHIKQFSKPKRVKTPLSQFYGKSYEYKEPYGTVLVMSPWNYPFLLSIQPTIGAIAAGNTIIIKPSEYAPHVSHIIDKMIRETCIPEHVCVIEGDVAISQQLLEERFDYIFFTGSVQVGKIVYEKASHYLTPVTLELGGKSPCIIDQCQLKTAAKRVAFGKLLNAGQTCVAPDYLLIQENLKEEFVQYYITYVKEFFPDYKQYVHIINERHFDRLVKFINQGHIIYGGTYDKDSLFIEPTILDQVELSDAIMQEEIFGPILPIITYQTIDEAIEIIKHYEKPLALYLFSNNQEIQNKIMKECHFGGGCINDTIIHLASDELCFGGVGESGIGQYHGRYSFETFSHTKSIIKKATWIDLPFRYYPYTRIKEKFIRMFLK